MGNALHEFIAGCVFVVIAVTAYLSLNTTTGVAFQFGEQSSMSSTTFPNFLAIGLGLLGGLFALGAARRLLAESDLGAEVKALLSGLTGRETVIAIAVIALLLAYAFLLKKVHFGLLTFVFLAAGFVLFGRRNPRAIIAVAAAGAASFYGLFVGILQLALNP